MKIIQKKNQNDYEPFFIVPSCVFEQELSPYELAVLFYLMMRADNETHTCWPSANAIAETCNMSDRKVRDSLHSLEEKNVISIKAKYLPTNKNYNRQTSNVYIINLYDRPPAQDASTPCTTCRPPLHNMHPPPAPRAGEIYRTIPNRTILNLTIPTLTNAEDGSDEERNSFIELKRNCFEILKNERGIEEETILLTERSLENLWHRKSAEYEGRIYSQSELRELIIKNTTPDILVASVDFLSSSKEPVRSPVAYLGKCILGAIVNAYSLPHSPKKNQDGYQASDNSSEIYDSTSTFDLNDFFAAALRNTYE